MSTPPPTSAAPQVEAPAASALLDLDAAGPRVSALGPEPAAPAASGMDWWLFSAAVALVTIGLVAAFSASYYLGLQLKSPDPHHFVVRHGAHAALGLLALLVVARSPYQALRPLAPWLLLIAVAALVLVLVSGTEVNHATRWIWGFQPSEVAKVAFIAYLARAIEQKAARGQLRSFWRGTAPLLLVYAVLVALLMKQPDMGTALVLGLLLFAVLFVAGARVAPLMFSGGLIVAAAGVFIALNPMRAARFEAWLDPFEHFAGKGYQLANSMLAVALGGPFGRGLGASQQKLGFLPEAHTDFVLAIWAEETGLIGVSLILLLQLVVIWRGFRVAWSARCEFGRLLAFGVTLLIGVQVCINVGVVLGMLPTKGLTLPFVSYGGTSLVVLLASVGLLLSVARGGDAGVVARLDQRLHRLRQRLLSRWRAGRPVNVRLDAPGRSP